MTTTTPLDVLLIESHPGIGSGVATDLTEAGHRVHHCFNGSDRGIHCRGLDVPSACPIERHVDVAFIARSGGLRPSSLEDGVRCAIRAHVPLVERGPVGLDPYAPWVTTRVEAGGDADAACRQAAGTGYDELQLEIERRTTALRATSGIDAADVRYEFAASAGDLVITVILPVEVTHRIQQAFGVRVLDALRGTGRTFGRVHVNITHDQKT